MTRFFSANFSALFFQDFRPSKRFTPKIHAQKLLAFLFNFTFSNQIMFHADFLLTGEINNWTRLTLLVLLVVAWCSLLLCLGAAAAAAAAAAAGELRAGLLCPAELGLVGADPRLLDRRSRLGEHVRPAIAHYIEDHAHPYMREIQSVR